MFGHFLSPISCLLSKSAFSPVADPDSKTEQYDSRHKPRSVKAQVRKPSCPLRDERLMPFIRAGIEEAPDRRRQRRFDKPTVFPPEKLVEKQKTTDPETKEFKHMGIFSDAGAIILRQQRKDSNQNSPKKAV